MHVTVVNIVKIVLNIICPQLHPVWTTATMKFVQQDVPRRAAASLSPRAVRGLRALKAVFVMKALS